MSVHQGHTWATLPQCVLADVMYYLPLKDRYNASLTCRHWSKCLYHPKLWHYYKFLCGYRFGVKKLQTFTRKLGGVVKHVEVSCGSYKESFKQAIAVISRLANMKDKQIKSFTFSALTRYPSSIEEQQIVAQLIHMFSFRVDESLFSLNVVDLNNCHFNIDDSVVLSLAKHHPNLKVLKIQASARSLDGVSPSTILEVVEKCHCIEELHCYYSSISTKVVESLASNRKNSFKCLSLKCTSRVPAVIDSYAWKSFASANVGAEVTIDSCDSYLRFNNAIDMLCSDIPLVSLKGIEYNEDLFNMVAERFCKTLRQLKIGYSGNIFFEDPTDGQWLINLVGKCTSLKELQCLTAVDSYTIRQLKEISPNCSFHVLEQNYFSDSDMYDSDSFFYDSDSSSDGYGYNDVEDGDCIIQ